MNHAASQLINLDILAPVDSVPCACLAGTRYLEAPIGTGGLLIWRCAWCGALEILWPGELESRTYSQED